MQLKILSWNIWYDGDLDKVNEFLGNSDADIIGLQEVMRKDGNVQLSEQLLSGSRYEFIYEPALTITKNGETIEVGEAILSRFPMSEKTMHDLSKKENRIALEVKINVNGKMFHVFDTHLLHTHQKPSQIQEEQAKNLIEKLPHDHTILMGDFNALPDSNAIKTIFSVMKNADGDLLPTWSVYPEGCPECNPQGVIHKLDNIFVSKDLHTKKYQVEHSKASDHLPISVIVEIQ